MVKIREGRFPIMDKTQTSPLFDDIIKLKNKHQRNMSPAEFVSFTTALICVIGMECSGGKEMEVTNVMVEAIDKGIETYKSANTITMEKTNGR